jgi:hypothetical protein
MGRRPRVDRSPEEKWPQLGRARVSCERLIFRPSPKPTVQVLDHDASPLRVLQLDVVNNELRPSNFYVFDDSIAVGYLIDESDEVCPIRGNFALYDKQSGKLLMDYSVPRAKNFTVRAESFSGLSQNG